MGLQAEPDCDPAGDVVGANRTDERFRSRWFDVPPDLAHRARRGGVWSERDRAAVDAALARLLEAARGSENAMPAIIAAVDAEATLGEICGRLREVFGDYRPAVATQI